MIYITGDCHGDYDRFRDDIFIESKEMTKDDYVIICGDFGLWNESKDQDERLDWLTSRPFTTLWVDGNHENYDLLSTYETEMWHGGKVNFIRPSIIHLQRGQIFEIEGKTFFTFGGASSHDISGGILEPHDPDFFEQLEKARRQPRPFRINHVSWWKKELPSEEEMEEGRKNLKKVCNKVDYVITHCTSSSIQAILSFGMYKRDILTDYLEEIKNTIEYQIWFFGHYHDNKKVTKKDILLYEQMIRLL